jgi:hypothetical protein
MSIKRPALSRLPSRLRKNSVDAENMAEVFRIGAILKQLQDDQKGCPLRPSFVKRRSSLVVGSAEARSRDTLHDSRFTDLQRKARTPLADFFSILLGGGAVFSNSDMSLSESCE